MLVCTKLVMLVCCNANTCKSKVPMAAMLTTLPSGLQADHPRGGGVRRRGRGRGSDKSTNPDIKNLDAHP